MYQNTNYWHSKRKANNPFQIIEGGDVRVVLNFNYKQVSMISKLKS